MSQNSDTEHFTGENFCSLYATSAPNHTKQKRSSLTSGIAMCSQQCMLDYLPLSDGKGSSTSRMYIGKSVGAFYCKSGTYGEICLSQI